jgi:hypothetical protein
MAAVKYLTPMRQTALTSISTLISTSPRWTAMTFCLTEDPILPLLPPLVGLRAIATRREMRSLRQTMASVLPC